MRSLILAFSVFLEMALPADALALGPLPFAETAPLVIPVADGCGLGSSRDPTLQECGTSFFQFHDPDRPYKSGRYRTERYRRCHIW